METKEIARKKDCSGTDRFLVARIDGDKIKDFVVCYGYEPEKRYGDQWYWGHYFDNISDAVRELDGTDLTEIIANHIYVSGINEFRRIYDANIFDLEEKFGVELTERLEGDIITTIKDIAGVEDAFVYDDTPAYGFKYITVKYRDDYYGQKKDTLYRVVIRIDGEDILCTEFKTDKDAAQKFIDDIVYSIGHSSKHYEVNVTTNEGDDLEWKFDTEDDAEGWYNGLHADLEETTNPDNESSWMRSMDR